MLKIRAIQGVASTRGFGSALFAGYGIEGSCLLLYVLAAAMRTTELLLVVLLEGEDGLEDLLTIVADVVVYGHGTPRRETMTQL
jgi:hypothetical protein